MMRRSKRFNQCNDDDINSSEPVQQIPVKKKRRGSKQKVTEEPYVSNEEELITEYVNEDENRQTSEIPNFANEDEEEEITANEEEAEIQNSHPSTEGGSSEASKKEKRKRGPTKMKNIAKEAESRIQIQFTNSGEPCGPGSISLSSFLGPLVREHVPVTVNDWRNIDDNMRTALWDEVQARYILDEDWQKEVVFQWMGCIWRSSKLRLVKLIRETRSNQKRLELKPNNIPSVAVWIRFVKSKTSAAFKDISDKYKALRRKQVPHTCSRKGMVRLEADMKKASADPSSVSRVKVWIKSRTKKDGTPVNTSVAETIDKLNNIEREEPSSATSSVRDDALSKVLGKDPPGRLRAKGRGATITKLSYLAARDNHVSQLKEEHSNMRNRVNQLESLVHKLMGAQTSKIGTDVGWNGEKELNVTKSSTMSKTKPLDKCNLLDWTGIDDIVAEGRLCSEDPKEVIGNIPLGPNAVKVIVDIPSRPDAFLWRPSPNMFSIQQAKGVPIAWPTDKVIMQKNSEKCVFEDNLTTNSGKDAQHIKCRLFNWSGSQEIVAEGRWFSSDPKMLVNGIPLGPNAMIILVDIPIKSDEFLWRHTPDMVHIVDAVGEKIAWPANNVVLDETSSYDENASSPSSIHTPEKKNCRLMDFTGSGTIVAHGRCDSNDPTLKVHFVPLGTNACRIWVDIPKVPSASLWRPTTDLQCIEDAVGVPIAWSADKVVMI